MKIILLALISLTLSACAPLVVTYPDGHTMTIGKPWGRAVSTSFKDKEAKKEYVANSKALLTLPEINLLKIPLGSKGG